jgi:hypothetical protein
MTEGREPPPDDTASPAPPTGATPPPPPPSSPILSAAPRTFEAPAFEPARAIRPLGIGSVLGRSFDTYLAQPLGFVTLAIPGAVGSLLAVPLGPTTATVLVTLLVIVVSFICSIATIISADDIQAGRPFDLGSAVSRALGRSVNGILSAIALFLALFGLLVVAGLVVVLLLAVAPIVAAISLIVVYALLVYVILRWVLALPAIALDGVGPVEALRVSWRITRGNVIRLVLLFIIMVLIFLPISLGAAFLSIASESDAVSLVLTTVAGLIVGPIGGIVLAVIYGDLTGRQTLPAPAPEIRRRRWILVVLIVVVGLASVVIAGPRLGPALERLALRTVPVELRGKILAGTGRTATDKCQVTGTKPSFASSDPIYIGGYFTRTIPRGQSATVTVYVNGQTANSAPVTATTTAVGCYYEEQALVNAPPATYKLIVTLNAEVIAQGEFVVN